MVCLCSCSKATQVHTYTCPVFFLSALHMAQPSIDLGYASLYIIKSVFTVLSLLGTYIITSPAIPMIITTNVSNQAFSWRVEIKGKGHSPAFKQISEPMFGSIVSCKHIISNKQILLNAWACHRRGLQMHPPSI